jgi:EpsI family protein
MEAALRNRYIRVLSVALVAQAAVFYAVTARREIVPVVSPLDQFPAYLGTWQMAQQLRIEPEVADVLKADDILSRVYVSREKAADATLFIAFFKTQRTGQAPHSPKNCLPGAGWVPSQAGFQDVAVPGSVSPITINRYVVSHGDNKSVVLYWYQSPRRVVASEYKAKFWLVADSIRYHRSDTALVRVTAAVRNGDEAAAIRNAVDLVRAVYPELLRQFPV